MRSDSNPTAVTMTTTTTNQLSSIGKLKVQYLPGLLKAESASAMTVSNKRMVSQCLTSSIHLSETPQALGTHEGVLHILDLSGE